MTASKPFRPMKGEHAPADLSKLRFPLLVPPKLDGIRCVIVESISLSNTLIRTPNLFVQAWAARARGLLDGLDGELIVGPPNANNGLSRTSSGVGKKSGEPDFKLYVFDDFSHAGSFAERFAQAEARVEQIKYERPDIGLRLEIVPHHPCAAVVDVEAIEEAYVADGYEGVMLRDPHGPYKYGKATVKEGWLLKLKRHHDEEAEIIGYEEQQANTNEKTYDARGISKRSTAKAGKVGKGTLGAVQCRMLSDGVVFWASGGTEEYAAYLWSIKEQLPGKIAKIKHWGRTHPNNLPRYAELLSIREPFDIPDDVKQQVA